MRMRVCLALAALLLLVPVLSAKDVRVRGYVTQVHSPTSFEIEDYRISSDAGLVLSFEREEGEEAVDFRPEDIRVGTDLEISGELDEKTGELRAKAVKVFPEEAKKIKRTAMIERLPSILKSETGWGGAFFADGQRIAVQDSTQVVFKPTKEERKAMRERARQAGKKGPEEDDENYVEPLQSLGEIHPNMFLTYEGTRQADGSILASRLEFMRNQTEKGEARMWQALTPYGKNPDFQKFKPGELNINGVGKFKVVPSPLVQAYIYKLGHSLVPLYQKALPESDPTRIAFKFFLVENEEPNAFALANGTVVVNTGMFDVLENEAQLAAVLSHEIAHAIQEHSWRQQNYKKGARTALKIAGFLGAAATGEGSIAGIANMMEAAIKNGYSRSLENQADRLSLQYMYDAGYDIREAPRVWKVMSMKFGDKKTSFFWNSHDNHTTRRSYLMAELRNNYADVDYSKLSKGVPLDPLRAAASDPSGKKSKVKVKY